MGIINQTLDASEQRKLQTHQWNAVANGLTFVVGMIPQAATAQAAQVAAFGLSGAPSGFLTIQRFVVGTGATVIALGSTFALAEFGTSGLLASGVSFANTALLAGDVICYTSGGGSSAAAKTVTAGVVFQPTEQVRTYFGLV